MDNRPTKALYPILILLFFVWAGSGNYYVKLEFIVAAFYNTPLYGLSSVPLITMIEQKKFQKFRASLWNT